MGVHVWRRTELDARLHLGVRHRDGTAVLIKAFASGLVLALFLAPAFSSAQFRITEDDRNRILAGAGALLDDSRPFHRVMGAGFVATLGTGGEVFVPQLRKLLADPDGRVRVAAAEALAMVGHRDEGLHALEDILRGPADRVALDAAESLGRLEGPKRVPLPLVLRFLASPDLLDRRGALRALSEVKGGPPPQALPRLRIALKDADETCRGLAASALVSAGIIEPVLPSLNSLLASANGSVALRAASTLAKAGATETGLSFLGKSLRDPRRRREAADQIIFLGPVARPLTPLLQEFVADPDIQFRRAILRALANVSP